MAKALITNQHSRKFRMCVTISLQMSAMHFRFSLPLIPLFTWLAAAQPVQLEKLENKTILLFTPHPDDDTFCCAGTLAMLAKRSNNIHIVIYTNDDKGSYDPDMTSERLARI